MLNVEKLRTDPSRIEVIRRLVNLGANLNAADVELNTALMRATWKSTKEHDETVALLVDARAQLELANDSGRTALSWAINLASTDAVRHLVAARANVNACVAGQTPLMWACGSGSIRLLKPLVDAGADLRFRPGGESLWVWNARSGCDRAVPVLCDLGLKLDADEATKALLTATDLGRHFMIRALVTAKADVNRPDCRGRTALKVALKGSENGSYRSEGDMINTLKALMELGAEIDGSSDTPGNLWRWVVEDCAPEAIARLGAAGIDVDAVDEEGTTALMLAAGKGDLPMVQALVAAKADVTAEGEEGETALAQAQRWAGQDGDYAKVVAFLLEKGAKPSSGSDADGVSQF